MTEGGPAVVRGPERVAIGTTMLYARGHRPDALQRVWPKPNYPGYPTHIRNAARSATKMIDAIHAGVVAVDEREHVTVELERFKKAPTLLRQSRIHDGVEPSRQQR